MFRAFYLFREVNNKDSEESEPVYRYRSVMSPRSERYCQAKDSCADAKDIPESRQFDQEKYVSQEGFLKEIAQAGWNEGWRCSIDWKKLHKNARGRGGRICRIVQADSERSNGHSRSWLLSSRLSVTD
jgi:hypothetical protein